MIISCLIVIKAQSYINPIELNLLSLVICISFAFYQIRHVKAKGLKKDKVNIITMGCSKNLVDSEVMLTQLRGNEINATHESVKDDSNIIIINTCGFIDNAKQESIDTILRYADAKDEGIVDKVYVTGCLVAALS